jgi:predicted Zn-dependent peptidase
MSVETDVTALAIREAFGELDAVGGARPVDDRELDVARAALTRGYPRNFETAGQIARSCAQLALHDLPDEEFAEFVPRVRAVDTAAVTAGARRYLRPAEQVTLIVGDRERVLPAAERVGLGAIMELEPDTSPAADRIA